MTLSRSLALAAAALFLPTALPARGPVTTSSITVVKRARTEQGGAWVAREAKEQWEPRQTAVIVCDMWDSHHCLNAVTEPEGVGAAVLIRAVKPLAGAAAETTVERPLLGPGLVCRGLGIDLGMNGWDLTDSPLRVLAASRALEDKILVGPRVGISSARALPLRYRLS